MDSPLNVLLIDNFDSFTFNLVDELRRQEAEVAVWRNDITAERALQLALSMPAPRLIVISPGPGRPEDAGCCEELVRLALGRVPLFGVCLGLQAIVQALGGRVDSAGEVVHGKAVWIEHDGAGVLQGLPRPLQVGRYHSLAARELPPELEVTARYNDLVMAVTHVQHPVWALQFHPESILTPHGSRLLRRTIEWAASWQSPSDAAAAGPGRGEGAAHA